MRIIIKIMLDNAKLNFCMNKTCTLPVYLLMQKYSNFIQCTIPAMMLAFSSFADEQLFGYTQVSETMPKGTAQVYQWVTHRQSRSKGSFSAQDYRTELEYGVTNRLQTSLYLNARAFQINNSAPIEDGKSTYPNRNDNIRLDGASVAFKYNMLSPFIPNKLGNVGLALYIEPGYSTIFNVTGESMYSPYIETRMIVQKNFFEDRLVTALNIENTFVKRKIKNADGLWQNDLELNITTGVSYLLHKNWYVGLEGRYHSEYPQTFNVSTISTKPYYGFRQQHVSWVGPNIHYTTQRWWMTLTWLTQLGGNATNQDHTGSRLYLVDHERNEFRAKIAYNF